MKISVKVKANAKTAKIEQLPDQSFVVSVVSVREKGQANEEVVKLLADYFDTPKSSIRIISGFGAPRKIIEILN